jgi:DUF1680 family protein
MLDSCTHDKPCTCSRRTLLTGAMISAATLFLSRLTRGQTLPAGALSINPITNAVPFAVTPLPLSSVRITGGPLKHAQDLGLANLLKLEPDRMMFYMRQLAGLPPKGSQGYGGWDGPGRNLTGHIAGHWLSGASYMYAATGDDRLKQRADYLVDEMEAVQNKRGNGYIGALMGGKQGAKPVDGVELFDQLSKGQIRSGGFDLNGMWSPWYVQHKIFAGLRDAYRKVGNHKALELSTKFAAWVEGLLAPLNEQQLQRMLATEFGGINESFADLYADTGDKRWMDLSSKFEHHAIIEPLSKQQDILGGKHGNTLVPKLLGELARFIYAGNQVDGDAAKFFWNAVVDHHTFATGGHGYDEYFDGPDKLSDEVDGKNHRSQDLRTCESCNVYNMVKFARLLFALEPSNKIAEFHERALFNHVLASIDFNDGQVCYMVPIGQGMTHEYQGESFTCCYGSGLENHALHGDGIYCEAADTFWVNLFAPSTAESKQFGMKATMDTTFPEADTSSLSLTLDSPKEFTLALRRPTWAGEGYKLAINGQPVDQLPGAGSYAQLKRTWKTGDVVSFTMPKALSKEPLPDNHNRVALKWGPLVLGADQGAAGRGRRRRGGAAAASPVFIAAEGASVDSWVKPGADKPGDFQATATGGATEAENNITFRPFYLLSEHRYGIYWDVYTPEEWQKKGSDSDADRRRKLEAATVGYAQPGQMQSERDFNYQGEGATVITGDSPGRRATKWFSFDIPVDESHPMSMIVTYNTGESAARQFDILIDGKKLKSESITTAAPAKFMDVEYPISGDQVKGKQKVTVRFEAAAGSEVAGVYGVRMIRADAK